MTIMCKHDGPFGWARPDNRFTDWANSRQNESDEARARYEAV